MTIPYRLRALPLALAIIALAAFAPQAARAQLLIDANNPEGIAQVLRDMGYRAQVETSQSTGNPIIRTAGEGVNWDILFYGCAEGRDCRSIQYIVSLRLDRPVGLEKLNEWNANKTVGQAYIADNGAVRLKQLTSMTGGVSRDAMEAGMSLWLRAMGEFLDFVGFRA